MEEEKKRKSRLVRVPFNFLLLLLNCREQTVIMTKWYLQNLAKCDSYSGVGLFQLELVHI